MTLRDRFDWKKDTIELTDDKPDEKKPKYTKGFDPDRFTRTATKKRRTSK